MGQRSLALTLLISLWAGIGVSIGAEDREPDIILEDITVTGLRVERRLKDTPVLTAVITSEEIAQSAAATLSDVLEDHGLMHTSNGMGDYITLNGMGESRVLFLIDGRRVAGRVAGRINGATMPIGDIERIEVVRGAQSALYGSDGIGGVINVITAPPATDFSLDTRITNVTLPAYQDPDSDSGLFEDPLLGREQTAYANATFGIGGTEHRLSVEGGRGGLYLNEDESRSILPEYVRGKGAIESGFFLGDRYEVSIGGSAFAMRSDGQTNRQGSLDRQEITRLDGHIELDTYLGDRTTLRAQVYDTYYARDTSSYSGLTDSWGDTAEERENMIAGELYATTDVRPGLMTVVGGEVSLNTLEREWLTLDGNSGSTTRDGQALVLQGEFYDEGEYSAVFGVRLERDSVFGLAAAPRVAAMYYLAPRLRILSGVGVGYRAPTFTELYLDRAVAAMPFNIQGNPDLRPEYSIGGNLGFEWAGERFFTNTNLYYTELFDEILYEQTGETDPRSGKPIARTDNLDRSFRIGVDAESRLRFARIAFASAGYNVVYAYDRAESEQVRTQPVHTARGRVGGDFDRRGVHAYVEALYFSPLDPNDDSTDFNEGRYQINLHGSRRITEQSRLLLSIDNLTGRINESLGPFVGPTVTIGIEASF